MRTVVLCLLISFASVGSVHAQAEGYWILFPDSTTIPEEDQRAIFEQLGYSLSADGTALEAPDCGPSSGRSRRPT